MTYDEAKATCLQHVMVSLLGRPLPALMRSFVAGLERDDAYGHGQRRWRHSEVKPAENGILR